MRITRLGRAGAVGGTGLAAAAVFGALSLSAAPAFADYGPTNNNDGGTTTTTVATASDGAPPAASGLAFTGADVAVTTAAGAAAIGLGGAFVLVSRRRRADSEPAA